MKIYTYLSKAVSSFGFPSTLCARILFNLVGNTKGNTNMETVNLGLGIKKETQKKQNPVLLIAPTTYKQLHHTNYKKAPQSFIDKIHFDLEKANLSELCQPQEKYSADLPTPTFTKPVEKWVESSKFLDEYLDLTDLLIESFKIDLAINIPKSAPVCSNGTILNGWFVWVENEWKNIFVPKEEVMYLDAETYKGTRPHYKPFMFCGFGGSGKFYAWLNTDSHSLPETISLPHTRMFIGHNFVSYDRRYIEEFYVFGHDCRALDSYAFYNVLQGMSKKQQELYSWFLTQDKPPAWTKFTCPGNLGALSKFHLKKELNKGIKELWVNSGKELSKPFSNITENIVDIWNYCLEDVVAGMQIFIKQWEELKTLPSKIFLYGQLERSSLLIGNRRDISEFRETVTQHNKVKLLSLYEQLEQSLVKLESTPYVQQFIEGWIVKDWYSRIVKSKPFERFLAEAENIPDLSNIQLPSCLEFIGWELDEIDLSKRGAIKATTLNKLKSVHWALTNGFETQIKMGDTAKFFKVIVKENTKIDKSVIPITGKFAPIALGLHWNGEPLRLYKNTWGIVKDNKFLILPHPKGQGNVGTPLAKDFIFKVVSGEFTSNTIDLKLLYQTLEETQLWEKFDKRFAEVYIHGGKWLPEINPAGTLTHRMTGAIVPVMSNEKVKKAGSEMKTLFGVTASTHNLVSADYSGQESEIFNAHIASQNIYPGLNVFEIIGIKYDIHQYVADVLSKSTPYQIPRDLAKSLNFANQFFAGLSKLTVMVFIGLGGRVPLEDCEKIAETFQNFVRGKNDYGVYKGGIASQGFNRIKSLAKQTDQKCLLSMVPISKALNAKVCKDEMTTRINFNIQTVGQSLTDIFLLTFRNLATEIGLKYQVAFMIHDQIVIECADNDTDDIAWLFQISHLVSKAVMYKRFGVEGFALNKAWFETVEIDYCLRKSPLSPVLTPTNTEALPLGSIKKQTQCFPSEKILSLLKEKKF